MKAGVLLHIPGPAGGDKGARLGGRRWQLGSAPWRPDGAAPRPRPQTWPRPRHAEVPRDGRAWGRGVTKAAPPLRQLPPFFRLRDAIGEDPWWAWLGGTPPLGSGFPRRHGRWAGSQGSRGRGSRRPRPAGVPAARSARSAGSSLHNGAGRHGPGPPSLPATRPDCRGPALSTAAAAAAAAKLPRRRPGGARSRNCQALAAEMMRRWPSSEPWFPA